MKLNTSGEDYLEAILIIKSKNGCVRNVDIAEYMGYSKSSITTAINVLQNGGFVTIDKNHLIHFTKTGQEVAEKIYERHEFFTNYFISIGVNKKTAQEDACRIEHAVSDESFEKLKKVLNEKLK